MTTPWYDEFQAWWAHALAHEPDVPDAMQVATVDPDGRPSVRTVLLKQHAPDGFVFYTHTTSRKGRALAAHPRAAAVLHWKSSERQVFVEGAVVPVSDDDADAYWASRPRGSQLGAWASVQSAPQVSQDDLVARVADVTRRFDDVAQVPRPDTWHGFRIVPDRVELWQGRRDRLHERREWRRVDGVWVAGRLDP